MTKTELIEKLEGLDGDADILIIFDGEDYEIDKVQHTWDVEDETQNIIESKHFAFIVAEI